MPAALAAPAFLVGTAVSLLTSLVLVSRLERVGERLGLSEALLGIVAALAADAPEVTAAVTAVAHHQQRVGAGVILGSNVFNLAALLGLGAVVAGRIGLHRKVVLLGGTVAVWVAAVSLLMVVGAVPAAWGLAMAGGVLALYLVVLGREGRGLERLPIPRRWAAWLRSAVSEEELELEEAIRPARGRWTDALAAVLALTVVIAASVTMERAASVLGARWAVPELVTGGLVLAAVTSLPNAVAAVYLAGAGRGARPGQAVRAGGPHHGLVRRADPGGAGPRLPAPRPAARHRGADHSFLRRVRRLGPGGRLRDRGGRRNRGRARRRSGLRPGGGLASQERRPLSPHRRLRRSRPGTAVPRPRQSPRMSRYREKSRLFTLNPGPALAADGGV